MSHEYMSPLSGPPARGYEDYQRLENWDSGILWSGQSGPVGGNFDSPILDVSRFAYLSGSVQEILSACELLVYWYNDAVGSTALGNRQIILSKLVPSGAQWRLPNLGPFAQLIFAGITGGNYDVIADIFATNRVHPLEFIPREALLVDQQNTAIAASGSQQVYPADYYSGPMSVWYDPAFSTGNLTLQALSVGNTWEFFDQRNIVASGPQTYTMVAPPGAWRFGVANGTAGASSYYLTAVPSTTGAT